MRGACSISRYAALRIKSEAAAKAAPFGDSTFLARKAGEPIGDVDQSAQRQNRVEQQLTPNRFFPHKMLRSSKGASYVYVSVLEEVRPSVAPAALVRAELGVAGSPRRAH